MFASKVWPISMDRGLTLTNTLAYYKGKFKMAVKNFNSTSPLNAVPFISEGFVCFTFSASKFSSF
jgi:hypothetical protein